MRTQKSILVLLELFVVFYIQCTSAWGENKKMDSGYFSGADAKLEAAIGADDRTAIAAAVGVGRMSMRAGFITSRR